MKVRATHRNARMAPRKIRPMARMLRNMPVAAAQNQLMFMPGKGADIVLETLKSAVANATHNHQLDQDSLTIAEIRIDEGLVMKRWQPIAKGMAHPLLKRNSHVTVIVEGKEAAKKASAVKKQAKVETVSADEYVKQEAKAQADEKKEQEKAQKGTEDEKNPVEDGRDVNAVKGKKEHEAFQKMKALQQGGDKKKTHRRKSIG
ncbi:MAG: 50S ribosomal protein L22 [Candidatus Andersenbacteria bacterium]